MSRSGISTISDISTISGITALGALRRLTDPRQRDWPEVVETLDALAVALDALARLDLARALALSPWPHPQGRRRVRLARAQGSRPISSLQGALQYCLGERVYLKGTLKFCIISGIISATLPTCMIMTTGRTLLS